MMPEFGNPFSALAKERKLTNAELVRAIRFMISAEYEAVQLYMRVNSYGCCMNWLQMRRSYMMKGPMKSKR